jgi:membrane protease YdiL (CAAX protease family)
MASLVAWAIVALVILAVAQGTWGALLLLNLKVSPAVPWAVGVMAIVLWLMWQYLGGRWWPSSTSDLRRQLLRANPVSRPTFLWAIVAGLFSIGALTGYWIVMTQLVKMPGNILPSTSAYPLLTLILFGIMASLVSPLSEEAAFRGYFQVTLERVYPAVTAIVISSALFALAHITQGLLWPKLSIYFLAGTVFGTLAYLTRSIVPGIVVHVMADMTFFALVWPYDTSRRLVWEGGADTWFWTHVAQAIVCTILAIIAFSRLASVTTRD